MKFSAITIILETTVLKVIKGNLFKLAPRNAMIIHGCNAQGVMGSGFAKQIKELYPDAYDCYLDMFEPDRKDKTGASLLGAWRGVDCPGGQTIFNAITQQYYGRDNSEKYVSYAAVATALTSIVRLTKHYNRPYYLPFIGGGLANGDRTVLMAIFKEAFEDVEAYLVIND